MSTDTPPQPRPDPDSQGFWDAAAHHALALQFCAACGQYQFPPLEACRRCGGGLAWQPVSGRGSIHSFIVQHHNVAPGFADKRPYTIGLVSPNEAPHVRIPAEIRCEQGAAVKIGMTVHASFEQLAGGNYKAVVFVVDHEPN